MATVQLADIINVTVFRDLAPENDPTLLALFQSGVIVQSPLLDALASADGKNSELPFWRDIDMTTEPNYSSDQPVDAVPQKVVQDEMRARKAFLNNGWSAMDLATELSFGQDPMRRIRDRTDTYWNRHFQSRLVSTALGVLNSNVTGIFATQSPGVAGDMIINVSQADSTTATAPNLFSQNTFIEGAFTMGDRAEEIRAIAVHSVVLKTMVKQQQIEYLVQADGKTKIPFYMGRIVIVDDSCPKFLATPGDPAKGFKYVSILFGGAAFGYGEGSPAVPVEIVRDARTGHGGGEEQLWTRKTWLIHPFGYNNENAVATGNAGSQKLADLATGTNWRRMLTRKNVPLAFLITNG